MNKFEPFCDIVRKLWPDRRFTAEQLHVNWLDICNHRYEPSVVGAVLRKCLSKFPKAPDWPFIFAELAASSKARSQGECLFQKLLEGYRLSADQDRREPNDTIWARWIKEGHRRITHTMSLDRTTRQLVFTKKESKPCINCRRGGTVDCGRTELECAAKRWADSQRLGWRQYLLARGAPIPAFLAEDYEKPAVVVRQPSGTLF